METLEKFARVEIKSTLRKGDVLWVGTKQGLCRRDVGGVLVPVPGIEGEVKGLGPAPAGFVLVRAADHRSSVIFADADGQALRTLDGPEGEKLSAATAATGRLFVGTKTGVFVATETGWERCFGGPGTEVIGVSEDGGRLLVSIKKQGDLRRPALAESLDGGRTFALTEMGDYGDVVIAASGDTLVTRWRGARARSALARGYKKHPISAAELGADGSVTVVDGDKIEVGGPGRRKMEVFHPRVAEAECVHILPDGIFFAGGQGAFLLDPLTGRVRDLAEGLFASAELGKRKRLFTLADGAVLAACTFGTFLTRDGGSSWSQVDGEWAVFDAERLVVAPDGRPFLLCQRAVFVGSTDGRRWDYVKPKLPHGSPHYGEFRSIAIGGDAVWYGTKQGLFRAPLEEPGRLVLQDALRGEAIEALAFDAAKGELEVAVNGKGTMVLEVATGALQPRLAAAVGECDFVDLGGVRLLVGEHDVHAASDADAMVPKLEGKGLHAVAGFGRVLLWSRREALIHGISGWSPVRDWPPNVRSIAFVAADRLLVSDRCRIADVTITT